MDDSPTFEDSHPRRAARRLIGGRVLASGALTLLIVGGSACGGSQDASPFEADDDDCGAAVGEPPAGLVFAAVRADAPGQGDEVVEADHPGFEVAGYQRPIGDRVELPRDDMGSYTIAVGDVIVVGIESWESGFNDPADELEGPLVLAAVEGRMLVFQAVEAGEMRVGTGPPVSDGCCCTLPPPDAHVTVEPTRHAD